SFDVVVESDEVSPQPPLPQTKQSQLLQSRCLPDLRPCGGTEVLRGLEGRSLSFPALPSTSGDIARVTWRTRGTHIAEAKPRQKVFTVDYLPHFRGRLLIHPTNLSLEMGPLELEDSGLYKVVVDTFSDPTNPKTFSYFLLVYGESKDGGRRRRGGTGLGFRVSPRGVGCHCRGSPAPSPPVPPHHTPP
uniref:Uncharacterized protein n=1 Tax=Calidris pygmaea TaxID=425635 RepID=A0A8C3JVH7_9CHAR